MTSATGASVTTTFVYRGDGLRDSRTDIGGATTTFTWDPLGVGVLACTTAAALPVLSSTTPTSTSTVPGSPR